MAIPDNREKIRTNLPQHRLERFLQSLSDGTCTQVPGSASLFAESGGAQFVFEGGTYELNESYELVNAVHLCAGDAKFVHTLISEHEVELSAAVAQQDFDLAKVIKRKVDDLKRLI